jgi:hypothetical protein
MALPRGATVEPEPFAGRHWYQMPGTSAEMRMLNFALFKRGQLDLDDVDAGEGLGRSLEKKWQDVRARLGGARRAERAREREAAKAEPDPLAEVKRRAREWAAETTGRADACGTHQWAAEPTTRLCTLPEKPPSTFAIRKGVGRDR